MANKALETQDSIFKTMMLQLNNQTAQQAILQQELQSIKFKLEQASKTLAEKDEIIGSLEDDLEHMIDQLVKIKHGSAGKQWLEHSVPGINREALSAN